VTDETTVGWVAVAAADELAKRKKLVVDVAGREVLLLAHDGEVYAFQNRCIHKDRELVKGVVLNGKLVCPGHQWAFALGTGWESVKEQCQPTYAVRVVDGSVEVELSTPGAPLTDSPAQDSPPDEYARP
jgi:nitrite reductase (NADH) small subunit